MQNRRVSPFLTCAVLLLAALPAIASGRKTYPMTVPAEGARTITFNVQEGDFVLRGDPNAKEVRMQVSIDRTWIFKLGEEGILKKLIKVEGEGTDHVTVRTNIEPSWKNWFRAEYPIDFEVVLPAKALLEIRDTSGKIEISGMRGDVDVVDTSGTLAINDVTGAVRVVKESGDIRIGQIAGLTSIQSKSGQMQLRDLAGLEITASDGNLDIIHVKTADIHNRGGNIKVTQVGGPLKIDDDAGEIVALDVNGPVEVRDTSGQIRLTRVGAVTIYDTSGDVRVDRAASLDIRQKESGEVKVAGITGPVQVPPGVTLKRQ